MAGRSLVPLVDAQTVRELCARVAKLAWLRASSGVLAPFTFVANDSSGQPLAYAPEGPSALPREELLQIQREFEYLFHVFPARALAWNPALDSVTGEQGELKMVVLCRSATRSWRYACPLTQDGPDEAGAEFVPHYELVPLERVLVPAAAWTERAPVQSGRGGDPADYAALPLSIEQNAIAVARAGLLAGPGYPAARDDTREKGESDLRGWLEERGAPKGEGPWGLRISPRVYYDVLAHPVAEHLKQLATLRVGRLSVNLLFDQVCRSFAALHAETLAALLKAFAGQRGSQDKPDKIPSLTDLSRCGSTPITLALAYWAYSEDIVPTEGHSLGALARKFNFNTAPKLERALRKEGWLRGNAACPICHQIGQYKVSRFSIASHFISFTFDCPACGHEEEYARDEGWVRAISHCPCKTCTDQTTRVAKTDLPPVEAAFSDVVESVEALTDAALIAFDRVPGAEHLAKSVMKASQGSWENHSNVRIWVSKQKDRAEPPLDLFDIYWWRYSGDDYEPSGIAAVFKGLGLRVSSVRTRVGPPNVKTSSRSVTAFCLDKPGSSGATLVNELLDALHADGLLPVTDKRPEPLRLQPYFALDVNGEDQLPLRRPLREAVNVEFATAALPSRKRFKAAFGQMLPDPAYIGHLISEAFLHAQKHRANLLAEVQTIDDPQVHELLADLNKAKRPGSRRVENILSSLGKNGPLERKLYAALFWNFTAAGAGSLSDDGVLPAGRLPVRESDAEGHPLTLVTRCPRCEGPCASFQIHECRLATEYAWELFCPDCLHHWRASTKWDDATVAECRCEGCLDATRRTLGESSVADVISTLVREIRQISGEAVQSSVSRAKIPYSLSTSGGRQVSESQVQFDEVEAALARGCQWRPLDFVDDTTLLAWATRSRGQGCTLRRVREMEESRDSPISDAALRNLQSFVERYFSTEGAVTRLPLQLVAPGVTRTSKNKDDKLVLADSRV